MDITKEKTDGIYEAICNIMGEMGAIGKTKKNTQGSGFMYRGVDDVMNTLQPLLSKYKVFLVPEMLEHVREERTARSGGALIYSICKIKYTFYALDGSNVQAIVIGESMDSGDKATNKAMSVAFKYACFQVFCIPTEEMKDPDNETHEIMGKEKPISKIKQDPKSAPAKAKQEPTQEPQDKLITTAQAKRLFAIAKSNVDLVRAVCEMYEYSSTKDIKVADYEKICDEIGKVAEAEESEEIKE